MQIQQLIDLLKTFPRDAEVRVAHLEDPTFEGTVKDLPILGVSTEYGPAAVSKIVTPDGPPPHYLVTSYLLAPEYRRDKSKKKS